MPRLSRLVDRIGVAYDVPLDTLTNLRIALDEIVTNIVKYAYTDGARHEIRVHCEVREGRLETTVEDDGPAFNPLILPPPDVTSPLESRPVGGLGVHFVKELMSSVDYERVNGRNRLKLGQVLEAKGTPA